MRDAGVNDDLFIVGCDVARKSSSPKSMLSSSFEFDRTKKDYSTLDGDPEWAGELCESLSLYNRKRSLGVLSGRLARWTDCVKMPDTPEMKKIVPAIDAYRKAFNMVISGNDVLDLRAKDSICFPETVMLISECIRKSEEMRIKTWAHDLCTPLTVLSAYPETWQADAGYDIEGINAITSRLPKMVQCLSPVNLHAFLTYLDDNLVKLIDASRYVGSYPCVTEKDAVIFEKALDSIIVMITDFRSSIEGVSCDLESINLKQVFQDLESFSQSFSGNVQVTHSVDDDCNLLINRTDLYRVLQNLVRNSHEAFDGQGHPKVIKFTASQTTFEKFVRDNQDDKTFRYNYSHGRNSEATLITVSDSGPGISENVLPYIFNTKFSTKFETGNNYGLGLSSVKNIVTQYGGDIFVRTMEGIGTIFYILFPKIEEGLN